MRKERYLCAAPGSASAKILAVMPILGEPMDYGETVSEPKWTEMECNGFIMVVGNGRLEGIALMDDPGIHKASFAVEEDEDGKAYIRVPACLLRKTKQRRFRTSAGMVRKNAHSYFQQQAARKFSRTTKPVPSSVSAVPDTRRSPYFA